MILGLIGFSSEQEREVEHLLASRTDVAVRWRTGALSRADAWWVNGARAQLLGDGSLRIASAEPGGRSVRLALEDVTRPLAFAEPLANRDLEPAYSFSTANPPSMCAVLDTLEHRWLAPTAVRRWIAGRLIAEVETLSHRVYHLVRGDRLLAVVDRRGEIGWLPGLAIGDLDAASWLGRPGTAAYVPASFHRATLSELVWDYAVRSKDDLLPARYRVNRIHFRRPPRIAAGFLGDDHLLVMRELGVAAASFAELEQRTGLGSLQLAQALAALYLTGSITTNERSAQQARRRSRLASAAPSNSSSPWSPSRDSSGFGRSTLSRLVDFTVPASLRYESSLAATADQDSQGGRRPARHSPA